MTSREIFFKRDVDVAHRINLFQEKAFSAKWPVTVTERSGLEIFLPEPDRMSELQKNNTLFLVLKGFLEEGVSVKSHDGKNLNQSDLEDCFFPGVPKKFLYSDKPVSSFIFGASSAERRSSPVHLTGPVLPPFTVSSDGESTRTTSDPMSTK